MGVRAVVVADHMQLHPRVGPGDALEEGEELDVAVPRAAGVGADLAGGDLESREQRRGAVADIVDLVVGLPRGQPRPQRQCGLGAVQGLDLGLRAPRGAALPDGVEGLHRWSVAAGR